ncbi:MAG: cyclic-phosphate processing receiver domain-containing protein [Candidatus Saccharibacteria bacterium]
MGKIVVVDDIRLSADSRAFHCRNTDVAVELLTSFLQSAEVIDELWLDYDMSSNYGIGSPNTMALAEWLIENQQSRTPLVIRRIFVHSRHNKAIDLVKILEPHFSARFGELPDPMWWDMPEEEEQE